MTVPAARVAFVGTRPAALLALAGVLAMGSGCGSGWARRGQRNCNWAPCAFSTRHSTLVHVGTALLSFYKQA